MRKTLVTLLYLVLAVCCAAQPGTLDTTFNTLVGGRANEEGANGTIRTLAVQSDGSIWIGGDFTAYNGYTSSRLARLDSNGSLEAAFAEGANATVHTIVRTPTGNTLVGGAYTDFAGNWYRDYLLQFTLGGWIDANFDTGDGAITGEGANGTVRTMVLQSDGKLLIGGDFLQYNRIARNRVARLKTDGTLDTTFDPGSGANGTVATMVLQPDGKILVGGDFTSFNGVACNRLARLHPNGSLDLSFNAGSGANDTVHTLLLQNNGKIVIGGAFTLYRGSSCSHLLRLNTDGSIDPSFSGLTNGTVRSLLLQPDGKILLAGDFTTYNGTPAKHVARMSTNGNPDAAFNSSDGPNGPVTALALAGNGTILVAGDFTTCSGAPRNRVARLKTDGSLDGGFYPGRRPNGPYYALAVNKGGGLQAGGDFVAVNGVSCPYYTSFDDYGRPGFLGYWGSTRGGNGAVTSILFPTDTTTLLAGAFTLFNGVAANRLVRLGKGAQPFTPGSAANNTIHTMALQGDGKIWIGGDFTSYNGTARNRVARLNANGTIDASFDPGSGANGQVKALALQPDGSLLVGGAFTAYNGVARNGLARLNSDGSIDASFYAAPGPGSRIESIVVQPDGKILVGGTFTAFNGTAARNLVRLHKDGSTDASFAPGKGANGTVHALLLQSDGKILAGGAFTDYNGAGGRGIARLQYDGSLDTSFHPGSGVNGTVYSLALDKASRVLVGGNFTQFNGAERQGLARLVAGPHSISTGAVARGPFCAGSELTIPFTATGAFMDGHAFFAELSSPSGSFKDSTWWIGTLKATASGTIAATLDPHTPAGTRYRIRVMSATPEVTGEDNGYDLTIHALPDTPRVLTPGDTALCAGSSLAVNAPASWGVQWYKDSVAISGAMATTYPVTAPGKYSVVTTQNGCASAMSPQVAITVKPAPARPVISQQGNTLTASVTSGVQWLKNGVVIPGATAAQYTVLASGLYSVRVTQGGCSAESEALNVVITALAGPQAWNGELTLYPVPARDVLHLTNSAARRLSVQLLDATGKRVRLVQVSAPSATLPLQDLAPGTYLLLITDTKKGETVARTIVRQ